MDYGKPETSDDLTCKQMSAVDQFLFIAANRTKRLLDRMEKLRFPESDPLFSRVKRLYELHYELSRYLHHESVKHGMGTTSNRHDE